MSGSVSRLVDRLAARAATGFARGTAIEDFFVASGRLIALAAHRLSMLLAASMAAATSHAADATRPFAAPAVVNTVAPPGAGSLGQVTIALGLVLAMIFAAAWLMRRMKGFGKSGTGKLDILADLAVGQKERAVLIRVGTTQILLGVAPGRVSTLHVLAEPVDVTPPTADATSSTEQRPNFKALLMKSLGKP
ncbi:MAG: flagellar biosynthetic protein FliO [Gammaproteobacteria bacterium]